MSKTVKLTKAQIDAIIEILPVRSTFPYYPSNPEYSAQRIRAEDDEWISIVREKLEEVEVDVELSKDTEKIKREFALIIAAVPKKSFVEEIPTELGYLTKNEIEDICSIFDAWYHEEVRIGGKRVRIPKSTLKPDGLYIPRPDTLWEITELEADQQKQYLRSKFEKVSVDKEYRVAFVDRIKTVTYERYVKAILPPGTAVGSIAGQSLGEKITQATLNVHKAPGVAAARQQAASLSRATELYNISTPKVPSSSIYFNKPVTYNELKEHSWKIRQVLAKNVLYSEYPIIFKREDGNKPELLEKLGGIGVDWHSRFERAFPPPGERKFEPPTWILRLILNSNSLYAYRLTPKAVAEAIETLVDYKVRCLFTPFGGLPLSSSSTSSLASPTSSPLSRDASKRSPPIIDIYVTFGAKGKAKGRPKAKQAFAKQPEEELAFANKEEYKLRIVFDAIKKLSLTGVPGISQLYPFFLPLVRFFTVATTNDKLVQELRFDRNLMRIEGVSGTQIEAYVKWRISMLAIEGGGEANNRYNNAVLVLERSKLIIKGLIKEETDRIKSYSGIESLSTFVSLVSDKDKGDGLREVTLRVNQDKLRRFGFSPYRSAPAKLVSLIFIELQPKAITINDSNVTIVVDEQSYTKLVKPPALYTFVRVVSDKITNIQKEQHLLELTIQTDKLSYPLGVDRVIVSAVKESGAFDVHEKREGDEYRLILTMVKDSYERFIRGLDKKGKPVWETELFVDVSTIIPTFNQWSYQTIGSNLKEVLALPEVNAKCTSSDDPNEIFDLFGIEATAAYLVTELNRTSNTNRDVDIRHIGLIVDTMCQRGIPNSVSRHGLAEQGAEAMTSASMEQASKTFRSNAFVGEVDTGQSPASHLFMGTKINLGPAVADVKMRETFLPRGAVEKEVEEGRKRGGKPTQPKFKPSAIQALRAGAKPIPTRVSSISKPVAPTPTVKASIKTINLT